MLRHLYAVLIRLHPRGSYAGKLDRDKLQALRSEVKRRLALSVEVLSARAWAVRGDIPRTA